MQNNQEPEEWDSKLDEKIEELKECQKSNTLQSCNPCDKFFDCELRKKYVIAVYESMNKGATGGFEF
jgi:recombinational DNA repair protein RecR